MEHSRLLKFLVPGRDKTDTTTMSESTTTYKIQYDYQNPTDVEAEVPESQNIREVDPTTSHTASTEEIADGASISEYQNGVYTVTKRTYTEQSEVLEGTKIVRTTMTLSTGAENVKEMEHDQIVEERPKTKIPKLKFRQAAERVRAERRKSKENNEHTVSHIPTPRTSIPKLSRGSKIPPPTIKPIVTKREIKQTIVTSKLDDDFDKIYEEIVEFSDGTGDLTDPEKVDCEFEEIIHAYDENKVPTPKVRQSKIPSLRRKSDHEIEAPKSSTRFTEKSKVRSIPRLKEISMRAKEDNNNINQVVRQYTTTVTTEKSRGKNDSENIEEADDIERKSPVKTSKLSKVFKTSDISLSGQNIGFANASVTKTSKITKIIKSEKFGDNDELLYEERHVIDGTDSIDNTDNKIITKTTYTKIVNPDSTNENGKELNDEDDLNDKVTKTTEVMRIIKTKQVSENNNENNIDITDNISKNRVKTRELAKIVRNEKIDKDSDITNTIKESQINTINSSVSIRHKHDTHFLKTESIEKTSVKVGIPAFNKQVSENSITKNTQTLYTNKDIERSISEGSSFDPGKERTDRNKILYQTVIENKVIESNIDTSPTPHELYTVDHASYNLNNNYQSEQTEIEYTKIPADNRDVNIIERNSFEVKDEPPEITKTVTITRFISSPTVLSKNVEYRTDIEDTKTINIEKDIEISQPSILKLETVNSKELPTAHTRDFKKDNITGSLEIEKDNTENKIIELKGNVGRLVNILGVNKSTVVDITKKDLDEELPKKKSILSKIAMFERQDMNEPMPKTKPRPEKIVIQEIPQGKTVHIHTPKIVEEVLKPVQTAETKDFEGEVSSPHDPFLTYKPLYEHYKDIEINKSVESLETNLETTKSLEVKTPNSQAPLSPLRKSIESTSTSNILVDAPVILVSPKINFKKNINLNTDENKAEFAKTVVSVKETKNIEVLKPVQINLDYEVSEIEVESSKLLNTSSGNEVTAFKDVKKNIAMYEKYSNSSKAKDKSTYVTDFTVDTKSDNDRANFDIKVKNESIHANPKPINETFTVKEDIFNFDNVKLISSTLTEQEITHEPIISINEIVTEKDDLKYDIIRPINEVLTAKDLKYEEIKPINTVLTTKEETKYAKVRPISEILTTKREIQYENIRPISQILTVEDENRYEKTRPISENLTVSENYTSRNSGYKNDTIKHKDWFHKTFRHNNDIDQAEIDTDVFANDLHRLDGKHKKHQSKNAEDVIRKVKSVAELDLGDAVQGKVNSVVLRMKSVERFDLGKKETIREIPRMISVSEKIALFERKVTTSRSDSVFISSRTKTVRARPKMQITEEEYQQKLEELNSVKKKYGRREEMPSVILSSGVKMPMLAVGTALLDKRLTPHVVSTAIELGYRAIDCAFIYGNEKEIGEAVREKIADGTVKRDDLFVTSKLWSTYHRRDLVEKACRASLDAMGLTYFDLYLIHNPMSFKEGDDPIPKIATVLQYSQHDYLEAWYGMEDLVSKGLVKNIGVSNFNSVQIQRILDKGKVKPVVNQVECHPYLSQQRLHSFCAERNIILSCFGTLGSKGTPAEYKSGHPPVIDDPLVQVMASGLNVTPAQLLIRYQLDCGHGVVVKTSTGSRLWDNLQALDFTMTPGQVDALHALNRNKRTFTFTGMGDTHKNYPFKIAF